MSVGAASRRGFDRKITGKTHRIKGSLCFKLLEETAEVAEWGNVIIERTAHSPEHSQLLRKINYPEREGEEGREEGGEEGGGEGGGGGGRSESRLALFVTAHPLCILCFTNTHARVNATSGGRGRGRGERRGRGGRLCDMFSPPQPGAQRETRKWQREQKAPENQEESEVERWTKNPFFGATEWGRGSRPAHLLKQNLGQGLPGPL